MFMHDTLLKKGEESLQRTNFKTYRVYRGRNDAEANICDTITREEALVLLPEAMTRCTYQDSNGGRHFAIELP